MVGSPYHSGCNSLPLERRLDPNSGDADDNFFGFFLIDVFKDSNFLLVLEGQRHVVTSEMEFFCEQHHFKKWAQSCGGII